MFSLLRRILPSRPPPSLGAPLSHTITHSLSGLLAGRGMAGKAGTSGLATLAPGGVPSPFPKQGLNASTAGSIGGFGIDFSHVFSQRRGFAGRQRGLKRRKHKKEPRRIQVSLGRRLELFYPKRARKVRVRMLQNSRGNVVFDPVLRKFYVFYYKQGTQVFRGFRARGGRFELARSKAVSFARQMADFYSKRLEDIRAKYENGHQIPRNEGFINYGLKLQPDCNLSGVRNVFFDSKRSSWVVCYNEFGVRKYKFFDVNQLGFQNSYVSAVDFLKFQLFKSHRFLHRRHRTRKNRPVLKC